MGENVTKTDGKSIWETKAGLNLVENLNVTLNELRDYMKTQNEINRAILNQVSVLKEEVISLHNNKADKANENVERD